MYNIKTHPRNVFTLYQHLPFVCLAPHYRSTCCTSPLYQQQKLLMNCCCQAVVSLQGESVPGRISSVVPFHEISACQRRHQSTGGDEELRRFPAKRVKKNTVHNSDDKCQTKSARFWPCHESVIIKTFSTITP